MNDTLNIKSNSHKSRERERQTVKPVAKATIKKQSEFSKILNGFLGDSLIDIKSHAVNDVIIPTIKRLILDAVQSVLYPGEPRCSSKRPASKISYDSYSNTNYERERNNRRSTRNGGFSYDQIVFDTYDEARRVLMNLDELMDRYGSVRVADLYDLAELDHDWTMNDYGWRDIRNASIAAVRDGYIIRMPQARPLD